MGSREPPPVNSLWVRNSLVLVVAVAFLGLLALLATGVLDMQLVWLPLCLLPLMALVIVNSGCRVGQSITMRFRTDAAKGQVEVSHDSADTTR